MARGKTGTDARAGAKAKSRGEGRRAAAAVPTAVPRTDERPATAGAAAANDAGSQVAAAETAKVPKRPVIRSFDHTVAPHIPLRLTLADQGVIAINPPAPPTILSILPEGSEVKAGVMVCELDSSGFRQALEVQQLRYLRAKAWVEQAGFILQASEIALREYQDGILPQDTQLVRDFISICETDRDRAAGNLAWAKAASPRGSAHRARSRPTPPGSSWPKSRSAMRGECSGGSSSLRARES